MPLLVLTAQTLFTPLEVLDDAALLIEDGFIGAIGHRQAVTVPPGARQIDLGEKILAPGFIDVHIHGGAGQDGDESPRNPIEAVARSIFQRGTTSFVATTLSAAPEMLTKSLQGLRSVLASWDADG